MTDSRRLVDSGARDDRIEYRVELADLDQAEQIRLASAALRVVIDRCAEAQCDVPLNLRYEWDPSVVVAALTIRDAMVPARKQREGYMITDRARLDARLRAALATFAPYTYFADFWDSEGHNVAEFDDNTDTILLRLSPDELARVTEIVGPDRVLPFTPRRTTHSRMLDRVRRLLRPGHGVRA